MPYCNVSHVVDTLMFILNAEQEFFRDFVREYEPEKSERQRPLALTRGIFPTRPREVMPILEIEPTNEATEWATTRTQSLRVECTLQLTVANSNPDYGVEYICGWVQRVRAVLNDPRRLQAWVTSAEGQKQFKFTMEDVLVPLSFMDSRIESVDYKSMQAGSLRQARMSWFCMMYMTLPARYFVDHWPHYTDPSLGPPITGPMGQGFPP